MAFDLDTLTLGEVARVEEISRQSIGEIGDAAAPKGRALAALAYVIKRRHEPEYSFDAALGLTLGEAQQIVGIDNGDEDDDLETTDVPKAPEVTPEPAVETTPEPTPAHVTEATPTVPETSGAHAMGI